MKLAINIPHASGNSCKGLQDQGSKVSVICVQTCSMGGAYISTVWCRGLLLIKLLNSKRQFVPSIFKLK